MAESDLDYGKVTGRFGLTIADTDDVGDNPDIIWCDEGEIDLIPLTTITKVTAGTPVPFESGQAVFTAQISAADYEDPTDAGRDGAGHLTFRGKPFMMVVDLTVKVNPFIPAGKATHRVVFRNVRAGGIRIDFPSRPVRITQAGPDGDGVNDLVLLLPVVVSDGVAITVGATGPSGASVESAEIVGGDELVFHLTDGTDISAGDLPAATAAIDAAATATTKAAEADTSADAAAGSASTASTAAATATTKAAEADTSATAASGSATTASGHATTATTKAGEASASATAAAGSATTASGHATTATTKAGEASSSASAASTAKTAAEAARDAAQGYATAADGSADGAAASAASITGDVAAAEAAATTATTKAGEAAASATAADGSADAAAASAIDAANSASEAAAGGVQKVLNISPDGLGNVAFDADDVPDGTTNRSYTNTEKTKLTGIATGATANSSDATLLARANHTGTQTTGTISDFLEAVQDAIGGNIAAGANMTSDYNDTTGVTTLSVVAPGDWVNTDPEVVRDTIGGALAGAGLISVTVNDAGDTITISTTATANRSDAATDALLAAKAPLASPTFTGTVSGVTKAHVGLGNVDNTADTAKPVSTAQQTALDLKAPLASPTFTGTPVAPTAAASVDSTQVATTAHVKDAIQGGSVIAIGTTGGALALSSSLTAATAVNAVVTITLNANTTFAAATMPAVAAGTQFVMRITQDATGSRTLTLTNILKPGGALVLSTAANAVDLVVFFYDGTSWYASLSGKAFAA